MGSRLLAVTIGVGPRFSTLAHLAAASCAARTGLPTAILGEEAMQRHGLKKPHHLKFKLFEEFPEADAIFYFDSDIIFLRDFKVEDLACSDDFLCVRDFWDQSWIVEDARRIGVEPRDYFNSGFFIAQRSRHASMLHLASQLQGRIRASFHDQTCLNAARAWLRIPTCYLPKRYNYLVRQSPSWPATENAIAAHFLWLDAKPSQSQLRYHQYWQRNPITDSPAVRAAAARVLAKEFIYERVGHDERRIRLTLGGKFLHGAGGCENRWRLTEEQGRPVLWLANRHLPACGLEEEVDGTWNGRWLHWEQMPVRLRPAI